jgi:hypothetical protein
MLKVNKNVLYEEGNELFGIPITIKDMFQMQGFDSTFGVASRFNLIIYRVINRCFKPDAYDGN